MEPVSKTWRLVVFLLAVTLLAGCATQPLAPEDKAVLVTAGDLLAMGVSLPGDISEFERTHKISRIDGGVNLEYQFDARSAGGGYPYIYLTIDQEPTMSSALAAYGAVKAGLGLADLNARDDSERFRYGDWSYFGTLLVEDEARGLVFYARDHLTVYTLMISGFPMDVDTMWEQLILPRLDMLSQRH